MLFLTIQTPCRENWNNMSPVQKGMYCNSCSKDVIDFSSMSDEEIIQYYSKRDKEKVCGRFRAEQLNRPLIDISPKVLEMNIPFWKKFLAIFVLCFSTMFSSCGNNKKSIVAADAIAPAANQYAIEQTPISSQPEVVPARKVSDNPTTLICEPDMVLGYIGVYDVDVSIKAPPVTPHSK